ncbi:MAG TPA: hypothetical protein VN370_13010 [Desulfitobacteriaceae bacterium]|jgi:hypothetical protein|nr:hypothetical protein [Desulfitobacteriaceae bacterium]
MSGIMEQPNPEKTSLNFGISIWSPSSAVYGSPTLFYFQPIVYGKVFASTVVLSVAQLFLSFIKYFFGLDIVNNTIVNNSESQISPTFSNQTFQGFLTPETPGIPLIVGLSVSGDFSSIPFSSSSFITLPIFTLPGIRGTLPLLILELLVTIFVRSVVPPELSGAKPLKQNFRDSELFNVNSENIVNLLKRFRQYIGLPRKQP